MTDLNSLARTLAERLMSQHPHSCHECVEAVIREAIDKTLEEAEQIIEERIKKVADEICKGEWATANHALLTHIAIPQALEAIRSLKQSNAVAEDEGPCADCGRPKSDSAMHLDSPGKGWGAALHWFKQSNSGRAEQGIVRE